MRKKIAVVDLFAGAGGLAEGFANARTADGSRPFSIELSVEKERSAHSTLQFRAFLRQFKDEFPPEYYSFLNGETVEPEWPALYPDEWSAASEEALLLELGSPRSRKIINRRLAKIRKNYGKDVVLVGGPPCQAYSVVGRSRNKGVAGYQPKSDRRHFLYREYIRILKVLKPTAFVMENVVGLLSSKVEGKSVLEKVLADLQAVGRGKSAYKIIPIVIPSTGTADPGFNPKDFIVKAEHFGVPQSRHRIIILGIRRDCTQWPGQVRPKHSCLEPSSTPVTVRDVLEEMPVLRSGLSQSPDNEVAWKRTVSGIIAQISRIRCNLPKAQARLFGTLAYRYGVALNKTSIILERSRSGSTRLSKHCPAALRQWLSDGKLKQLPNNDTRGHMPSDLRRYFFAAVFAEANGSSPTASDYPAKLSPNHKSWDKGDFGDRFRVQVWDKPATTVTCHISKDGHYFIHPDPTQCRSLTVREAARLQTFPDNYLFKGNRTQQYVQVGNAVPPYLGKQIAEALYRLIKRK